MEGATAGQASPAGVMGEAARGQVCHMGHHVPPRWRREARDRRPSCRSKHIQWGGEGKAGGLLWMPEGRFSVVLLTVAHSAPLWPMKAAWPAELLGEAPATC